ncbi:Oligomerization domain-containing protein [Gongronella butleri]|nr:Oligomerization domain-containing protein [Gongronella butleri]
MATRHWASKTSPSSTTTTKDDADDDQFDEELDRAEYPELYPDQQAEDVDTEWFVDESVVEDKDFVPLWQQQAKQHLVGREELAKVSERLLQDGTVTPDTIKAMLEQAKMDNIQVIDVRDRCDWADYMIVAESNKGDRFLTSVADEVAATIRKTMREHPDALTDVSLHMEGHSADSGWLLLDLGRCVVHLFTPEVRKYYDLDGLWKGPIE